MDKMSCQYCKMDKELMSVYCPVLSSHTMSSHVMSKSSDCCCPNSADYMYPTKRTNTHKN